MKKHVFPQFALHTSAFCLLCAAAFAQEPALPEAAAPEAAAVLPEAEAIQPAADEPSAAEVVEAPENGIVELEARPGAPAAATDSTTNLITIALDKVPVQDVVNMFSRISGANIVVAGTFTNPVTASVKDVEWKAALNLILSSVNLASIEDASGIIMVVNMEQYRQKLQQIENTKPLATRIFTPRYINPVDLVDQIKRLKILSRRGTIITSQSSKQHVANLKSSATKTGIQNPSITTSIIVTDIKEYVDKVEELFQELDRREPQVFIEARIIDVVSSSGRKVGFDWSMLDAFGVKAGIGPINWQWGDSSRTVNTRESQYSTYDNRSQSDIMNTRYDMYGQQYEESTTTYSEQPPGSGNWVSTTRTTPTRTTTDSINRGTDVSMDRDYTATDIHTHQRTGSAILSVDQASLILSALEQDANANMLSHPMLVVGNRVEANIHVGEDTWLISLKKTVNNTGAAPETSYEEESERIPLGLKLWVIAEIDLVHDVVRLTVDPSMTIWLKNIETTQGSVYPVTSTRTLSTRVNVPSSHTVVIGGLIDVRKSKQEKRVPLLGDLPLLGLLFRHTVDAEERHNLIIMLTPTILKEDAPLTGLESIAMRKAMALEIGTNAMMGAFTMDPVLLGDEEDASDQAPAGSSVAPAAPAEP